MLNYFQTKADQNKMENCWRKKKTVIKTLQNTRLKFQDLAVSILVHVLLKIIIKKLPIGRKIYKVIYYTWVQSGVLR